MTRDNSADKIVNTVTEKVTQGLTDEAYTAMKDGLMRDFSQRNAKECGEEWKNVSDKLTANGTLPKMTAAFLKNEFDAIDQNHDGSISKGELTKVSNSWHPMYKGMATQALKDFDTAASLGSQDDKIDKRELGQLERRNWAAPREKFVDKLVKDLDKQLNDAVPNLKSPTAAAQYLYNQIGIRLGVETPAERIETLQAVTDALKKNGMIAPLATSFMAVGGGVDANKDGKFSMDEVSKFKNSRSPLMKEFTNYVVDNFYDIPRGPMVRQEFTAWEAEKYADKMNVERWAAHEKRK